MLKPKYLECYCCSFLAVIPQLDDHLGLVCPFCLRVGCSEGRFEEIDAPLFKAKAQLVDA